MTDDAIKALEKEVKRRKRIASEQAMQLHDLVEDRLPKGYQELPGMAEATFAACKAWQEAVEQLESARA